MRVTASNNSYFLTVIWWLSSPKPYSALVLTRSQVPYCLACDCALNILSSWSSSSAHTPSARCVEESPGERLNIPREWVSLLASFFSAEDGFVFIPSLICWIINDWAASREAGLLEAGERNQSVSLMFKEAQIPTFNNLKALRLFVRKHGEKNAPCACTLIDPSSRILPCFRPFSLISLLPTSLFFITKICNSSTSSPKWHFHICSAHTAAQTYDLIWIKETDFKGEAENWRRIAAPALVHVQK